MKIRNTKEYLTELFANISEDEILQKFEVEDFSQLRVKESSKDTWMIEKWMYGTWNPINGETGIEKYERDRQYGIVD